MENITYMYVYLSRFIALLESTCGWDVKYTPRIACKRIGWSSDGVSMPENHCVICPLFSYFLGIGEIYDSDTL